MSRALAVLATVLSIGLCSVPAWAQSITVPQAFQRKLSHRLDDKNNRWMNYQDCVSGDVFTWETKVAQFSGLLYEVWAGKGSDDCTIKENRTGGTATCWNLFSTSPTKADTQVQIAVQDVAAQLGTGGPAACERTDLPSAGEAIRLYFMLVSGNEAVTTAIWETKLDLLGPPAPTSVSAGVGERRLIVSWTPNPTDDLIGYKLYCAPSSVGGTAPAAGPTGSGLGGAAGDGGLTDAAAGAAGAAGASGASGAAGSTSSGGAAGSGGAGTGNPACPSANILAGVRPDPAYECASVESQITTSAEAKNLINGTPYAVGVAAVDLAGNSGPLSAVACGTPQEVDDFFELYRRAGGQGGGGFCSIHRGQLGTAGALLGALMVLGLLRRRSRS